MNNIHKYIIAGLFVLCVLTMSSCKKWLDIQPVDRFTEETVFSKPNGFSEVLNGIYLDIGKPKLYGANMTCTTLDIFAQRYNVYKQHKLEKYQQYDFNDKDVKETIDQIWSAAYINVLNLNKFIQALDKYPNVLDKQTDSLFRGEAYALRAYLQFDILRMFGPVYNTDSTAIAIPYYEEGGTKVNELLPANQVINKVVADLQIAEKLLKNDPIVKAGIVKTSLTDYLNYRNYRMNYFAIKGLQARVYQYRNDKVSALAAAKKVIDNAQKFPWTTSAILSNKKNPDRIFSTEVLFGVQSMDLYTTWRDFFSPELEDDEILAPHQTRLINTFESNENDYRYIPNWLNVPIKGKQYRTFYKYSEVEPVSLDFRFVVPLLRLSEMYYIVAECTNDLSYLNTVRNNRNLTDLPKTASIAAEIQKEYQKEFYGEGQLWFYYKRTRATSLPNPFSASGSMNMNTANYVFPLPLSEISPR